MSAVTFAMIKPGSGRRHTGDILKEIIDHGFIIRRLQTRMISLHEATQLYADHVGSDFFRNLAEFTCSGPVVLMELLWNDATPVLGAVQKWRSCIGPTNSAAAPRDTLRGRFGNPDIIRDNAVHGAANDQAAARELAIFFPRG